jgi:hypothetical protein
MKANELRIGNYVSSKTTNFIIISAISADSISDEYGNKIPLEDLIPLKLFDYWLDERIEVITSADEGVAYISFLKSVKGSIEANLWFDKEFPDSDLIGSSCEYVHQLQNLCFGLTQAELEIVLHNRPAPVTN